MRTNSVLLKPLLVIAISFCASSCEKHLPACKGNCSNVTFEGTVFDKTNNTPLQNQEVKIHTHSIVPECFFCTTYKIADIRTGKDGRFKASAQIDPTLFQDSYIEVDALASDNYILYPTPIGLGIDESANNSNSVSFDSIDVAGFGNLSFGFYPKILLHVNLHRTTAIGHDPDLDLQFTFDGRGSGWGLMQSESNKDTTLTIYTSANIFTTVKSTKHTDADTYVSKNDSIKCTGNGNNSIDIYY